MSVRIPDGRRFAFPAGCCRAGNTVVCSLACRRADDEPMMGAPAIRECQTAGALPIIPPYSARR